MEQAGAGMIIGMGAGYIAEGVIEGRNKSADREAGKNKKGGLKQAPFSSFSF